MGGYRSVLESKNFRQFFQIPSFHVSVLLDSIEKIIRKQKQKKITESFIESITESGRFDKPIATMVRPTETFWQAELYHQDYYLTAGNFSS